MIIIALIIGFMFGVTTAGVHYAAQRGNRRWNMLQRLLDHDAVTQVTVLNEAPTPHPGIMLKLHGGETKVFYAASIDTAMAQALHFLKDMG